MKVTRKTRLLLRLNSIVFILLFIALIALTGWVSYNNNVVSDWTYGSRNSLSYDTLTLLNEIEQPIIIRSYQPKHPLYKKRAEEIFNLYKSNASQLDYSLLDPNLDTELAQVDGIKKEGQSSIKLNGKSEIINDLTEQSITNALLRLYRNQASTLYFLTGHGERDPASKISTGYYNLSRHLQQQGIETRTINLLTDDMKYQPGNTLVIAAPEHELVAGEIEKILSFINQGGNILWLQDPADKPDLKPVSDALEMSFLPGVAIDNDEKLRSTLGLSHPAVIAIISYKLHPVTEAMDYFTLFITASAMQVQKDSEWQTTSLLLTQENSWTETDGFILDINYDKEKGDTRGPLTIGLALERTINLDTNQRVVIIGDSDFISNNNIGQGANLSFITNTINWLAKDDRLISINPVASPDTRLDLNTTEKGFISITFLIILPVALFSIGFYIWIKRKNRS